MIGSASSRRSYSNIYTIDELLFKIGYPAILLGFVTLMSVLTHRGAMNTRGLFLIALVLLSGGVALASVGHMVRAKEKMVNGILASLSISKETQIPALCQALGYKREKVLWALKVINRRGLGYYVVDSAADAIVDARLTREIVFVEKCASCGRQSSLTIALNAKEAPRCNYCSTPFDSETWERDRDKALGWMNANVADHQDSLNRKQNFNIGIFILLLIFAWPFAIMYYMHHYQSNSALPE